MPKICYVGNFAELSVGEPEVAKSLEELGYKVLRLDERFTTIAEVENACEHCDLLLFCKFRVGTPLDRDNLFKRLKIPYIAWLFDLYFGL